MKTSILPLALVSLASGAVSAQEGFKFTPYGTVDVAYASATNQPTGASKSRIITGGDAPSILGISASKELANQMKVGISYEGNVSSADGKADLFTRSANFSISSSWGTVRAGRQYDPSFLAFAATDPRGVSMNNSGLNAWINGALSTGANGTSAVSIFTSNTISWTDKFGGFTPTLAFGTGNQSTGGNSAGNVVSLGLVYADGPLTLSGGMVNNTSDDKATKSDSKGQNLGAAYTIAGWRLAANYLSFKAASGTNKADLSTTGLGGSYDLGGGLSANAAFYSTKNNNTGGGTLKNTTAGLSYALDKQITVYGQLGMLKASSTGFATANAWVDANGPTYTAAAGKNVQSLYLGTRVSF